MSRCKDPFQVLLFPSDACVVKAADWSKTQTKQASLCPWQRSKRDASKKKKNMNKRMVSFAVNIAWSNFSSQKTLRCNFSSQKKKNLLCNFLHQHIFTDILSKQTQKQGFQRIQSYLTIYVMIDDFLWPCCIGLLVASFAFYSIRKIKLYLTHYATQLLVQGLFTYCLNYCSALPAGLPACTVKLLQMAQNRSPCY